MPLGEVPELPAIERWVSGSAIPASRHYARKGDARSRVTTSSLRPVRASGPLAKMLGISVPLEHERGYHIMVPCDQPLLSTVAVSAERRMTITPMEEGMRFTGTEEFAGADAPPDRRRTDILARGAKHLFPDLDVSRYTTWLGRRPGMPDSKPIIARSQNLSNTVFALRAWPPGHDKWRRDRPPGSGDRRG